MKNLSRRPKYIVYVNVVEPIVEDKINAVQNFEINSHNFNLSQNFLK